MSEKIERALWWIGKGFSILPCQPNSKYLVSGFGQYRAKLETADAVTAWWKKSPLSNVAILTPQDHYVLDFDNISVYCMWLATFPAAGVSYTETTPSGGKHVFFRGEVPAGIKLIQGAEVKRIVIVSPSVVCDRAYTIDCDRSEFRCPDVAQVLSPLSVPGHATPAFLQADQIRRNAYSAGSRIGQIKKHFKISSVLKIYHPEIETKGRNEFQGCKCPLEDHKKSKAPFFFSDEKGFWKCHACGIGGDVINLYARLEGVNMQEAISRMWKVMA